MNRPWRDIIFQSAVWALSSGFVFLMGLIVYNIISRGGMGIDGAFLTGEMERAGRAGGIFPILVSTFLISGISVLVTVVLGVPVALALSHIQFRSSLWAQFTRTSLEVLATVPSVVFGLFGHLLFVKYFGFGYSIIAGALTLSLMCLPFFIRILEDGFKSTPIEQWTAAQALSLSYLTFSKNILLRSHRTLLASALTLSLSRALSETAALIFTSGYSARMPESLWDSGRTLSVHIMDLALNVTGGDSNAFRSAFVLLSITFFFQLLARGILVWRPLAKA